MSAEQNAALAPVLFSTHQTKGQGLLAHAQLNLPKSLNALNTEMVKLLLAQLNQWQEDDSIAVVLLSGSGEKAFCAGGDVVALHNAMKSSPGEVPQDAQAFFSQEYELDYLIHSFTKPIVVLGNGIVMGGGMGLFAGAQYRITTDTTRMAMPEITIGLFPDVGGSYFLNKMPANIGKFLGLTGVQFNGPDAKHIGLSDYCLAGASAQGLLDQLTELDLGVDGQNTGILDTMFANLEAANEALPPSNLQTFASEIASCMQAEDLTTLVSQLKGLAGSEHKWLQRAGKTLASGSPITMHLVQEQLSRSEGLSLLDCFKMELNMACRCTSLGEFEEGVRALLIDKDGAPKWQYQDVSEVPDSIIESFFQPLWEAESHPLNHLKG